MIVDRRRAFTLGLAATACAGLTSLGADGALAPSPGLRGLAETSPFPAHPWIPPAQNEAPVSAAAAPRRAFLHNLHTGEMLDEVYYEAGRYVPGALAAAMRVLRDWRNGQEHMIDARLFDLLHSLREHTEASAPFQIICGYRSPATNAALHERSREVAAKSQHLLGKALDIRLPGVDLSRLHAAALSLKAGGVGYYPQSDFVHVDVGPLRHWAGT